MEPGDWIGVVGLVTAVAGLVFHWVRFAGDERRFAATQRRLDSQEDSEYLHDLRARLQDLKDAALAYADAPDDPGRKQELTTRYEAVEFLSERAQWHDVRTAALRLVYTSARVTSEDERLVPGLAQEIDQAMGDARRVIGARLDELRKER
jgi:hypothetical protein